MAIQAKKNMEPCSASEKGARQRAERGFGHCATAGARVRRPRPERRRACMTGVIHRHVLLTLPTPAVYTCTCSKAQHKQEAEIQHTVPQATRTSCPPQDATTSREAPAACPCSCVNPGHDNTAKETVSERPTAGRRRGSQRRGHQRLATPQLRPVRRARARERACSRRGPFAAAGADGQIKPRTARRPPGRPSTRG